MVSKQRYRRDFQWKFWSSRGPLRKQTCCTRTLEARGPGAKNDQWQTHWYLGIKAAHGISRTVNSQARDHLL